MGQAPSVEPGPGGGRIFLVSLLDLILRVAGVSFPFSAEGGNCVLIHTKACSFPCTELHPSLLNVSFDERSPA